MTTNNSALGSMTSEMNVTPLIDVLLVLLIIFMVIVPATSRGEATLVPKPPISGSHSPNAVVLEVLKQANGVVGFRINQREISREELPSRLAAIYSNRAQRVLFVKGDDQLSFTQVADAIDIGHAAGVEHVGLITPRIQAGQ